jgi:LmbE family N-acetylglucosaminyl deacetylase
MKKRHCEPENPIRGCMTFWDAWIREGRGMPIEDAKRLLVLAAHPDDETIGCGILLQRSPCSLVVFAVDGAPAGYRIERRFGSLRNYSEERFKEASRALALARNCSIRRLKTRRGVFFPDRHLFEHLEEAADSLLAIAQEFLPDAIVSHACEGGHVDHDACSLLAKRAADALSVKHFEFPLYWKNENGQDIFQEFRNAREGEMVLNGSETEIAVKNKMLAEYKTQGDIVAVFSPNKERFRPARNRDYSQPSWNLSYPGNWRSRLGARLVRRRFSEFQDGVVGR